uniref:Odorant receptor n=1 Tax=Glossina morsitans morsitans TaxID=37546 RepID=A0ABK9MIN8_GLOMM
MFFKQWLPKADDALPSVNGLSRHFTVQQYTFAAIGLDPKSLQRPIFNKMLALVPMLGLFSLVIPMIGYASLYKSDILKVTDALSPVWEGLLALAKFFYFIWNRQKVIQLLRKIWIKNLEVSSNPEELTIIAEANHRDYLFSLTFCINVITTGVLALAAPLIIATFYTLQGEKFLNVLEPPLKATYPFDFHTPNGLIALYVWDSLFVYFIIFGNLSIDGIFSWFTCNIAAHFRILRLRLKYAGQENGGNITKTTVNGCIDLHRQTIELAEEFNKIFRVNVFIKFTISCLQIACLAFQLVRGKEKVDQIFHFSFLTSVTLQFLLYCYGGQKIKDESLAVSNSVYESFQWQNVEVSLRKSLLIFMMRSQKACDLTGVFFTADLPLFLWVFKTAGSFITMLLTLADNRN